MLTTFIVCLLLCVALVSVYAACPDSVPGCTQSRSQSIHDGMQAIKPSLNFGNPWTACISNSEMNAAWQTYYNANGGKVPYAPNGDPMLSHCKNANQYCYGAMLNDCDCVATCDELNAWDAFTDSL